jgi:pentatricopeptide repeat protein
VQKANDLAKEGKWDEAFEIFKLLKQQGKLTNKEDMEAFSKLCLQLGKQKGREKNYADAIAILNQAPKGTKPYSDAQKLARKYQNIQDRL